MQCHDVNVNATATAPVMQRNILYVRMYVCEYVCMYILTYVHA